MFKKQAGAASGAWYYPANIGSDSFTVDPGALSNSYIYMEKVTVSSGTQITKIAAKIGTNAGGNMKIGLFTLPGTTATPVADTSGVISSPIGTGWVEYTLAAPYSISSPVDLYVGIDFDTTGNSFLYNAAEVTNNYWNNSMPYADFPTTQSVSSSANVTMGARIWAQ